MTAHHYALVTLWNPVTEHYNFIGGQEPIEGKPDEVKRNLENVMRKKHGADFVSVRMLTMPANFSQMENERRTEL